MTDQLLPDHNHHEDGEFFTPSAAKPIEQPSLVPSLSSPPLSARPRVRGGGGSLDTQTHGAASSLRLAAQPFLDLGDEFREAPAARAGYRFANLVAGRIEARTLEVGPEAVRLANAPGVALNNFLAMMVKLYKFPPSALLLGEVYLMRMLDMNPGLAITTANYHRLTLIAVMIASKVACDIPMSNAYWAQKSGLYNLKEINTMEAEFLQLIDYRLEVTTQEIIDKSQ